MKRCSTSLLIRQMQIKTTMVKKKKTTMVYHLITVKMTIIKKSPYNVEEGVEKREPSYSVERNVNWYSYYE